MAITLRTARPTIVVYRGDHLAAAFVRGAVPVYHGAAGERVRAPVEGDRPRYNPWALEVRASGLYHDTAEWFLASVLPGSGLPAAGFRVLSFAELADRPPVGAALIGPGRCTTAAHSTTSRRGHDNGEGDRPETPVRRGRAPPP